jgi:RecJ-like exonuclease
VTTKTVDNILYMEEGEVEDVVLSTKRVVCPRCDGRGTHTNPSIDGTGISATEWAEWTDDSREGYLTGRYDVRCETCGGRNVIEVVDEDALCPEYRAAWEQQCHEKARWRYYDAMERRMGA